MTKETLSLNIDTLKFTSVEFLVIESSSWGTAGKRQLTVRVKTNLLFVYLAGSNPPKPQGTPGHPDRAAEEGGGFAAWGCHTFHFLLLWQRLVSFPLCHASAHLCVMCNKSHGEKTVSDNAEEGEMLFPSQKGCEWLVIAMLSMPYSVSDAITMRPKRASMDVMYFLVGSSHMCFDTLAKSPIVKLNFVLSN